jgi:hypothetical protein
LGEKLVKKFVALLALTFLISSCGDGSNATSAADGPIKEGNVCQIEGEVGNTSEGKEMLCQMMPDGILAWRPPMNSNASGNSMMNATLSQILGNGSCDENSKIDKYSASIGDIDKMSHIYPMGGMITTHITPIDHIYIYYPENSQTKVEAGKYLVTSPADGKIVNIEDFQKSNNYPYPDFRVVIEHSCSLYSVFIHVGTLAPGIELNANVKAGQTIADDGVSPGYDFSTFDENVKLNFANMASYSQQDSWKPYTANPFNYFPIDIKEKLEAKSLRVTAPFDGKIDWDDSASVQGNWFEKNTNGYRGKGDQTASFDNHGKVAHGYWDTHLAFAPDAVDETAFIYSIGDWEGCPCQFMSKENIDPKTIKVSDSPTIISLVEFYYENSDGSKHNPNSPKKGYKLKGDSKVIGLLALQLNSDGTLKVEKIPNEIDSNNFSGFTDNSRIYER